MKRKILTVLFVVSFAVLPAVTNAGFFDLFRAGQGAQVRTSTTLNTGVVGYKQGDQADVVLQVQQALSAQKLYSGAVSGVVGPRTVAAVKAWQKARGLSVTGVLDTSTIRSILGRGSDNTRDGGNRDGEFNGNFATTPPSLDYLQSRCGTNEEAFVRILSPWEGDLYVYDETGVEMQIFVCDATGTGNTHLIEGIVTQQIDIQTWSAIGVVTSAGVTFDDSDMTPYGANTWLINYTFDENHFLPGHYSILISDEGGYKINNVPQYSANMYAGWTRPFEVADEVGGVPVDCVDTTAVDDYPRLLNPGQGDVTVSKLEIANNCNYPVDLTVLHYTLASSRHEVVVNQLDLWLNSSGNLTPLSTGSDEFSDMPVGQDNTVMFPISGITIQPNDEIVVQLQAKAQAYQYYNDIRNAFSVGLKRIRYVREDGFVEQYYPWVWNERIVINQD